MTVLYPNLCYNGLYCTLVDYIANNIDPDQTAP